MLFGLVLLDESLNGGIAAASEAGYRHILSAIRALGYPYLVRIWNYFPRINVESDGLERYRAFCVGPDCCRLDIALASAAGQRAPPVPVENPRQVSAYRYPALYGPRSPLFSRAVVKQWARSTQLYISGTASVVGH